MKNWNWLRIAIIFCAVCWGLAICALVSKAYSEEMDVRNYWEMTCFPDSGSPYRVAAVNARKLTITSDRGHARDYKVTSEQSVGRGFVLKAEGLGAHGWRQLTALFSANRGALEADGKFDHCGGDLGQDE
jgi:hypothetical protein